jgi:hypothetical protein
MTSGEIFKHAWRGGCRIVETAGTRLCRMVRKVPRVMRLRCETCGRTWTVTTTGKGGCPRGWRKCPHGCNAARLRREHRASP